MAAITTAIAAGGLALSAYGMYRSNRSSRQAASITQQQVEAANEEGEFAQVASQEQADITRRQEELRRQEARQSAMRSRRNVIRQGQIARATSVTNAANSGTLQTSSFVGAQGQIINSAGANLTSINDAFIRGEQNFDLNEELVASQERLNVQTGRINQQQAQLSSSLASNQANQQFNNSLFTIGQGITQNSAVIGRVGSQIGNTLF